MKTKLIIIIVLVLALAGGGYFYYKHYYVDTLMLSEIVGETDNGIVNFLVDLGDFDTGLTRHDIKSLKSNSSYWCNRINEVDAIQDPDLKEQAYSQLLSDMMEDPTLSKVCKIITVRGLDIGLNILEMMI
jgi:hypothetical protein